MCIQILAPPATSWVPFNISVYYSHYKIIMIRISYLLHKVKAE